MISSFFLFLLRQINSFCKQRDFWVDTESAIRRAYRSTDNDILDQSSHLGKGGSTAVTAILINGHKLVVANVGDSRAVICKKGVAEQLSVDHEPSKEKQIIESKGGFVSNLPGNPYFDIPTAKSIMINIFMIMHNLGSEVDRWR